MALIFNRTGFGDDFKPVDPVDYWPKWLLDDEEQKPGEPAVIPRISMNEVLQRMKLA